MLTNLFFYIFKKKKNWGALRQSQKNMFCAPSICMKYPRLPFSSWSKTLCALWYVPLWPLVGYRRTILSSFSLSIYPPFSPSVLASGISVKQLLHLHQALRNYKFISAFKLNLNQLLVGVYTYMQLEQSWQLKVFINWLNIEIPKICSHVILSIVYYKFEKYRHLYNCFT